MGKIYCNVLVALVCVTAVASCKKDSSPTGQAAQAAMAGYAAGYNNLLDHVKSVISRYESTFPEGPTDKMLSGKPLDKPHLIASQSLAARAIDQAKQSFQDAKQAAPTTMANVATAADETLAAATRVLTLYGEAQKYYDAENYLDDKLAKGKDLHGKLVAAFGQYRAGLTKLSGALDQIEDAQAAEQLKKYEAEKSYGYWIRKFNIEAKKFVNTTQKADTLDQLGALAAAYKPVDDLHAELTRFAAARSADLNSPFSSYASATDGFDAAVRKLLRAIKDASPDQLEPVGDAIHALVVEYNNLVSVSNTLYTLEEAGGLK